MLEMLLGIGCVKKQLVKLALGKALSDKGCVCVVKLIVVRQGKKDTSYSENSEGNCRLAQNHCSS